MPLKAWCPRFFNLAATKFGSLIQIDEATASKSDLSKARILLKTPLQAIPRSDLEFVIDGKVYKIQVKEEIDCPMVDID